MFVGVLGENKYTNRVRNDYGSFGAMPWTTLAVSISMGCTEDERSAIIDGLELRPKSAVHGGHWDHKVKRAESDENTLAARIRWEATIHGPPSSLI